MAGSEWLHEFGAWVAALVAAAGSAALLRKRLSKDSTERTKDRTEEAFVQTLLKRLDDATELARSAQERAQTLERESAEARRADAETIARLDSRAEFLRADVERLEREMVMFKRRVGRMYPDTRPFVVTDFTPLAPPDGEQK